MQAPFELTTGKKLLEDILASKPVGSPHWNEAQNRFQFIDRLLTECLGWQKPNIEVESSDESGGKSDYLLGTPPKAVLEAKREAHAFDFPPAGSPTLVRKIRPLLLASKKFEEAVHQVIPYCVFKGAQIAIVCNGPQLVVFQAYIPNISPLDGECILFNGFESYVTHFPQLWKLLSPEGIAENRAYRELAQLRSPRLPPKASVSIAEPNQYRYRNRFQENLRSLSSLLLEEIEDNPKLKASFYKECYVPVEANNRNLLLSKNIISLRYKRVADDGVAPVAIDSVTAVGSDGSLQITDPALTSAGGTRPIVVVGDVGVGKTSFFENLHENLAPAEKANTYFIHINLGLKANLSVDIKSYVLYEIPRVLKSKYSVDIFTAEFANAIYHADLRAFDESVQGLLKEIDPPAYQKARIAFLSEKIARPDIHLQAALGHLSHGRRKQIVLVIDNADQRTFEVQQQAFLIAQELASTRNVLVFVALRPSTFYLSKTTGALSGYQNRLLSISPPPADEVIQKRLVFATLVAEGKIAPAALSGIHLHVGSVVAFLQATLRSIRTNRAIRQFLGNITGGNTRAVIELVTAFVGSPNVDSKKIVEIEERTRSYNIPLHEFTKHALLGDYAYYNSNSSLVACNIFDISSADPREHFLASLVIGFLSSNLGIPDNDGFVSGTNVFHEMLRSGYVEDQIRHALKRLATKRLIETPHSHYRELRVEDDEPPEKFYYRVTTVGMYHVQFWTGSFAFLDAVSTDTPIFDQELRQVVTEHAASFTIRDRYNKATAFRKYLEDQWHLLDCGATYYDFPALVQRQNETFLSVRRAAGIP